MRESPSLSTSVNSTGFVGGSGHCANSCGTSLFYFLKSLYGSQSSSSTRDRWILASADKSEHRIRLEERHPPLYHGCGHIIPKARAYRNLRKLLSERAQWTCPVGSYEKPDPWRASGSLSLPYNLGIARSPYLYTVSYLSLLHLMRDLNQSFWWLGRLTNMIS